MTTREEFDAWFANETDNGYFWDYESALAGFEAARSVALEEAAKECDLMQASYERQAKGGDNTGASDFRADAAEQCALGIRALK